MRNGAGGKDGRHLSLAFLTNTPSKGEKLKEKDGGEFLWAVFFLLLGNGPQKLTTSLCDLQVAGYLFFVLFLLAGSLWARNRKKS